MWSTLPERIENRIIPEPNSGCWLWCGVIGVNRYGYIRYHGIDLLIHRLVYELCKGSIPKGLNIDHLCKNKACCNPDHLEPVTQKENVRRGDSIKLRRAIKFCPRGHEYNLKNTYYDNRGNRHCRRCHLVGLWIKRGKDNAETRN